MGRFGSATFRIPVSVVVNPDKTGNNLSNKVLKIEKPSEHKFMRSKFESRFKS
jgi:hypothetical protein